MGRVVATGEFGDERNTSGWARLTVKTNPVYADELTMWGAGYLEGRVTAAMVWENWYNLLQSSFGGSVPAALQGWFKANLAWMDDQVRRYAATQPYWRHVELLLLQLRGIHQGYQESAFVANSTARALPFDAFFLLNSDGDMEELCVVRFSLSFLFSLFSFLNYFVYYFLNVFYLINIIILLF